MTVQPGPLPDWALPILSDAVAVIATSGVDGVPHVVPISVTVRGDALVVNSGTRTRKVYNASRNPFGTITLVGTPKWWIMCSGPLDLIEMDEPGRTEIVLRPTTVLAQSE